MNCSLACASASPGDRPAISTPTDATAAAWVANCQLIFCLLMSATSVRKRPKPQLRLADLPQARQPVRLEHEEYDDQPPEDHRFQVRLQRGRHLESKPARQLVQCKRQQNDERRPEIR